MRLTLTEGEKAEVKGLFEEGALRFVVEVSLVLGYLPEHLKDNPLVHKFKKPKGWRLNIYEKLLNTFMKDAADLMKHKDCYHFGLTLGMLTQIFTLEEHGSDPSENKSTFMGVDGIACIQREKESIKALTDEFEIGKAGAWIAKELPDEHSNFFKGYSVGVSRVYNNGGGVSLTKATDATMVYFVLLIFGDFLEKKRSVEHVYYLIKELDDGVGLPHSLESFKRICNRIGFVGVSYRRIKLK